VTPAMKQRIAAARTELAELVFAGSTEGASERTLLQSEPEFLALVDWMMGHGIRRYLELGFFTGAHLLALDAICGFELVAGADDGAVAAAHGVTPRLPKAARICRAKLETPTYRQFRHDLGKVDLVFIDADHSYGSVRQDYEREKRQPHRFLAFHDIANAEHAPGVVRLWSEIGGKKRAIVHPGSGMGIGIWSATEKP